MRIEKKIGRLLLERRQTLAVAESCTGGLAGHLVTSVAGSSRYFEGGIIAYSNRIKVERLGVDEDVLRREGAVSEAVAGQMAREVRNRFGADFGIGVTGVAGPGGGSDDKPVGTVFIALADQSTVLSRQYRLRGSRAVVKREAARTALEVLRDYLNQQGA